jgi:parallel beta-helix repeat protein
VHAEAVEPATAKHSRIDLKCQLSLKAGDVVTKQVYFSGKEASGARLDCLGGTIDTSAGKGPSIVVRSLRQNDGSWSIPQDVDVRNCTIKGWIHVRGPGFDGTAEDQKTSAFSPGHTKRSQAAAPSNISFSRLRFVAADAIPLYVATGVTKVSLADSVLTGTGEVAIYLDAESGGNVIRDNVFNVRSTKNREQLAIDGSANNEVVGNVFINSKFGGIFLYRNCGERGVIRHQTPEHNTITQNTFIYNDGNSSRPAVWLSSRNGRSSFCFQDPAYPFGSSASNLDFARFNVVRDNIAVGLKGKLVADDDVSNDVAGNVTLPE